MASGTVKWFNPTKGFGFIQPESGGKDVFVHISAVERAGLHGLNEGQKISYEVQSERGREAGVKLQAGSLEGLGGKGGFGCLSFCRRVRAPAATAKRGGPALGPHSPSDGAVAEIS